MSINKKIAKKDVLQLWESKVRKNKDYTSTGPDYNLRELELFKISKFLGKNHSVADFGCGTGKATYEYSKLVKDIVGIDFSPSMIKIAKEKYRGRNIRFIVGDILNATNFGKKFDVAMSTRCVINVMNWKRQIKAINNMIACLKPKGTLLMMESCEETFNECDKIRSKFGLEKLERPWHNKFLNIKKTVSLLEKNFERVYTSSMGAYYLISRIVYPAFAYPEQPQYGHKLNKIALKLAKMFDSGNILGNISPITLIVGKNRK